MQKPTSHSDSERVSDAQRLADYEEALSRARHEAQLLQQITRGVRNFAVIVLTPDGRVDLWNEGAERILGWTAEEIHGQFVRIIFTPEDQAQGTPEEELRAAAKDGQADDERWLQRKDGSRFWADGKTSVYKSDTGEVEGFIKILKDESARRALEDELRRVNASLEERIQERTRDLEEALREMGAFSYSIAHDLRGPLRAMSGFAQALTEDYAQVLGDAGKEYAERISSAALRMQKMIDDLLDYSRLTRAEMPCHPLDPGGVVDLVLATLFPEIEALEADVTVERPFPIVLAHEVTLGQVLQNLVANALKFVPENVTPRIRIRSEARDGHIRLWIEDNGIGIAPQYQDRIFGVFERLDSSGRYPGTGIGLAIVKRAVERMKGKVGVDSSLGGGSRFWVDLRKPAPP